MLNIKTIFRSIQGEGPFTGWPAIFIRLAGCSIRCKWCDTDYENGKEMSIQQIQDEIDSKITPFTNFVVITGGEPLQQDIISLVMTLHHKYNFKVQIETSGMVNCPSIGTIFTMADIVCSPKTSKIHEAMNKVDAWKYVVGVGTQISNVDGLPVKLARPYNDAPVYIQPLDEGDARRNKDNQELVIKIALKFNYRLSLQIHKVIGVE